VYAEPTTRHVAPGAQESVRVGFNTRGLSGQFTKAVSLFHSKSATPTILSLLGFIKPAPKAGEGSEIRYPHRVGALAFSKLSIQAGEMQSDQTKEFVVHVKNKGDEEVKLTGKIQDKSYLKLKPGFSSLAPGETGKVMIQWRGEVAKDSRLENNRAFYERLSFYTNEAERPRKAISVAGRYKRVLSEEELAKAPQLYVKEKNFDGGEILEGEVLEHRYIIQNKGKSELKISSVKASCGCTATAPEDKTLEPGQTSYITARFNSNGKHGNQHKTITVTTNDPRNPRKVLHLRVQVKKDPYSNSSAPLNN
jgi:uncharacterized cupredoxin-like copper-binding protein